MASAVEAATPVKSSPTVEATASWAMEHRAASYRAVINRTAVEDWARATVESGTAYKPRAIIRSRVIPIHATPAVIPRACADEEPAGEPAGSVIAIGGASIRVVAVVAIGTNGRCANCYDRSRDTNSNANHDSLRLSIRGGNQQNAEHREKSEISHIEVLLRARNLLEPCS